MYKIIGIIFSLWLYGCSAAAGTEKQLPVTKPKLVWTHEKLYGEARSGKLDWAAVDHQFLVDSNVCKVQGLQVPIPAPSCSTTPAPDCSGQTGLALGLCRGQMPYQKCDYSSVNAAKEAQAQIQDSCMKIKGWTLTEEKIGNNNISLVDTYSGADTDALIAKYLKVDSLTGISKADREKAIDSRWYLISTSPEYEAATFGNRQKILAEFISKHLYPFYSDADREDAKIIFETKNAFSELQKAQKKIDDKFDRALNKP